MRLLLPIELQSLSSLSFQNETPKNVRYSSGWIPRVSRRGHVATCVPKGDTLDCLAERSKLTFNLELNTSLFNPAAVVLAFEDKRTRNLRTKWEMRTNEKK